MLQAAVAHLTLPHQAAAAFCCLLPSMRVLLPPQLFTQVILISLLWAPNSGGLSLMGDVAQVMVDQVSLIRTASHPAAPPAAAAGSSSSSSWTAAGKDWVLSCLADGQSLMVVMTLLVVLPLSCQKHMRSLETAAAVGMLVILALLAVLMVGALQAGLPALADGELPLWSLKVGTGRQGGGCRQAGLSQGGCGIAVLMLYAGDACTCRLCRVA